MKDPRHCIIPARAVFDPRLTLADVRILAAFGVQNENQGWCDARQDDLASRLGVTRQTVNASIKKLASIGYVETRPLTAPGRGKIGTQYRVLIDLAEPYTDAIVGCSRHRVQTTTAPMSGPADVGSGRQRIYNDISTSSSERLELRDTTAAAAAGRARATLAERVLSAVSSPFLDAHKDQALANGTALEKLIQAGADEALDLIPTIARLTARNGKRIRSWGYFVDAIREATAQRLAPVEPIQPGEVSHVPSPSASEPGIRRGKLSPSSVVLLRQLAASDEDDFGRVESIRVS